MYQRRVENMHRYAIRRNLEAHHARRHPTLLFTVVNILLFFYLIFMISVSGQQIPKQKSIYRPHLGLYMDFQQEIVPSTQNWIHTYFLKMPHIYLDTFETKNQTLTIFEILEDSAYTLFQTVCKDPKSYQCMHYNTDIKFLMDMIADKKMVIATIMQSIDDLLPKTQFKKGIDRSTRSILPIVGRAWSILFGNPDQDSFAILSNQVAALANKQKVTSDVIIKMTNEFSTVIKVSQSRMDGLI